MAENAFNPIAFVTEVGGLMLDLAVYDALGDAERVDNIINDLTGVVNPIAADVVRSKCWDYSTFLTFYPQLKGFFIDAEHDLKMEQYDFPEW